MSAHQSIEHLPEQILFDLARNPSAQREYRKAAVELLLDQHSKRVEHPEIASFLAEIKAEREAKAEVEFIVESAVNDPPEFDNPALIASVTTRTL